MRYSKLNRKELGRYGEEIAAKYLAQQKIYPITKNYRCRNAEIDLIVLDGEELVFVEVKTRRSLIMGPGVLAITEAKLKKIRQGVAHFLQNHHFPHRSIRIDAIEIQLFDGQKPKISHLKGVS